MPVIDKREDDCVNAIRGRASEATRVRRKESTDVEGMNR
jgi:hypothetical protein